MNQRNVRDVAEAMSRAHPSRLDRTRPQVRLGIVAGEESTTRSDRRSTNDRKSAPLSRRIHSLARFARGEGSPISSPCETLREIFARSTQIHARARVISLDRDRPRFAVKINRGTANYDSGGAAAG